MVVARELSKLGTEGLDATMRKRRREWRWLALEEEERRWL
jgi:hypothetical protein